METSYTIIYQGDIVQAFSQNNISEYMILNDQLAVIYVPVNFNETILNRIPEVAWWQRESPLSSLIEINESIAGGVTATVAAGTDYIYNHPYLNVSGAGILVAIVDSGIDYLHPDFIKNDGTSRIISIWDQESSKNNPPEGMIFGSEFSQEQINKAIADKDPTLSVDNIGTGTIAAGIAVGSGRLNSLYKGVAINSELVVVKLRHYEGTYKEGRINYLNTDFLAAIKYVIDVSKRDDRLVIINLTVADRSKSVIITNLLDTFPDLSSRGIIVVSGAGNEGNTDIHYEGTFRNEATPQDIVIQVGEQKVLDITVAANGPGKIAAILISPSGEMSDRVIYSPDIQVYKGKFNLENSTFEMSITYPWIFSGNEELMIRISNVKPGIWTLRLYTEFMITGDYDVYLPNKNLIAQDTRFIDPKSYSTITLYGTTENVITVGAYNDKTTSMWIGSSKGPVKERYTKPDIVAPGVDIISTFINQNYAKATGTGVSSSLATGALALLMDYISQQSAYARRGLFTRVLKTYLMLGATKKDIYVFPNSSQGYGILNIQNTTQAIARNL
ncbi:bile acid germinant receptor pseudoprotease CspC [Clostridium sp. CCUG 7971]|uniref:bile acid germinant receptor pseudoprotease CspC n=1 Tax=Clostridium sp. CCUG 7971 TaxID=2811414 RepID=UPI001ABB852C|nr:bile acid germinant receptor pseudoprotease CspC [Clostridium sp. CCUG 7971]MBO3445902.1 S8 family peptidase [Clostridium sp. CCUG 7971]